MIYRGFRPVMFSISRSGHNFSPCFQAARNTLFLATAFALSLAIPAWSDGHGRAVTFVHATDPHLFVPDSQSQKPATKAAGERQESLNKKALADMLQRLSGLSGPAGAPAFLVLTGDLGVDPCDISSAAQTPTAPAASAPATSSPATSAKAAPKTESTACAPDPDKRKDQVQRIAQVLGSSPLKEIYLVAGNNDVAHENADDDSLAYFNKLIAEVQTKLDEDKTGVQLYNLTACYASSGAPSSCYADIAGASYRLIGFPSYSFKNVGGKSTNNDAQAKQFATFRTLLDQARQAGKQVLIVSHVPEIDDPYTLAQDRYAAVSPAPADDKDSKNPRSAWSTWNVTTKLLNDWKDVLASETVLAVLAGHLHDSHKEIYRPPYAWSSDGDYRLGFRKLFLAPPLAVKKQETSPIQARGFSLMTLAPDHIEALLYWYNQETSEFKADAHWEHPEKSNRRWWRWPHFILWMWQLDSGKMGLRLAVILIALLTAYLTVVAIWNIPAVDNPLAAKTTDQTNGQKNGDQKPASDSPFANDFGKTVIAGLSGLAVTEVAKALGGDQSNDTRWLYIIWFIFFFFVLLFVLSGLRAVAEGIRAVVALPRYSLARAAGTPAKDPAYDLWLRFIHGVLYWWMRFVHWFFSLRVPLLTCFDTFINLIQGKNQTLTRVFSDTIIDQQRNSIRVAHAIRKDLTKLIERRVFQIRKDEGADDDERAAVLTPVRVGISVLSADQSSVFYISQSPGSSKKPFIKRSVAWVCVFTGVIRWFKQSYREDPATRVKNPNFDKIVLFDNASGTIADDVPEIKLSAYYQDRNADYQAFVMFPFPWPQRAFGSDYIKGAIHISFSNQADFSRIWHPTAVPKVAGKDPVDPFDPPPPPKDTVETSPGAAKTVPTTSGGSQASSVNQNSTAADSPLNYPDPNAMLDKWCDAEVRAALINSLAVLGELLRKFNETIYTSYIEPGASD